MKNRIPFHLYIVASIVGLLGYGFASYIISKFGLSPLPHFQSIVIHSSVYLLLGFIIGLLFPNGKWKLGACLSIPLLLLTLISLLFAGFIMIFIQKDLPFLLSILISGSLGSLLGSHLRNREQKKII